MKKLPINELELKANEIRQEVIKMIDRAGSGHPAGALGVTDILTAFYFNILQHDPQRPDWEDRDRLVLSAGHLCAAQYACLAQTGYFSDPELKTFRQLGSRLQGHPERKRLPGIETTSGPLGSGLAQAAGMALAGKLDEKRFRVFCLTSDGEHDCGNHWEAVMLAAKYQLTNLTALVDRNRIQSDGPTEEILPLESLKEKYQAFGWRTIEIDGHQMEEIINAVERARAEFQMPTVIICQTTPGKGVSFMENNFEWHGKAPNKDQSKEALTELNEEEKEIKQRQKEREKEERRKERNA